MKRLSGECRAKEPMALLVLSGAAIPSCSGSERDWCGVAVGAAMLGSSGAASDPAPAGHRSHGPTLEDANWCDVLRGVVDYDPQASVVVVAPSSADEILWSEVMWRGVHDMLVEPFTKSEAQRILEGALRAGGQVSAALA